MSTTKGRRTILPCPIQEMHEGFNTFKAPWPVKAKLHHADFTNSAHSSNYMITEVRIDFESNELIIVVHWPQEASKPPVTGRAYAIIELPQRPKQQNG